MLDVGQALAAGRQELQQRLAATEAQLQRAVEDAKLEQERRRVSDEGAPPAFGMRFRLSDVRCIGLAAALAASHNMKEDMRGVQNRLAAAETSAAAAAAAAPAAAGDKAGKGEEGGLVQQKEYIRKLKAVLKEREAELALVTEQLKETRAQEAQFLAEVQLLQGRIKKLSSSSISRRVAQRASCCAPPSNVSCNISRRQLETRIQELETAGQGTEQQLLSREKMYKAQVMTGLQRKRTPRHGGGT